MAKKKSDNKPFRVERDIIFYSLRYCMNRRTYSGTTVREAIIENISLFTKSDVELLIKEIEQEIERNGFLGDKSIDHPQWINFIEHLKQELESRKPKEYNPVCQ